MAHDLNKAKNAIASDSEGLHLANRYIKFASSSSFGNTFSILAAAIWLPFVPLQAIQVIFLNAWAWI